MLRKGPPARLYQSSEPHRGVHSAWRLRAGAGGCLNRDAGASQLSKPAVHTRIGVDMKGSIAFALVGVFTTAGFAEEQKWPQFRGPGGSGVADAQKPPVEIGPD